VARVLRAKFRLGLFEDPYVDPREAEQWNGHPDHRNLALEAARRSIVLLKNEKRTLPLKTTLRSLAVIGPDAREARLGGYSGPGNRKVSILQGITGKVGGKTAILYAEGCGRQDTQVVTIPSSCLVSPEGGSGLRGEYFPTCDLTGPATAVRLDSRIEFKWTLFPPDPSLAFDAYSVRWVGKLRAPRTGLVRIGVEGDDGYRLWIDGKLLIDNWKKEGFRLRTAPLRCVAGKDHDVRMEFFESRGNAQIRLVWDAGIAGASKRMEKAVRAAQRCDAALIVAGIEEGEFRDRADIGLPGRQEEMIRRIAGTGKPVVVVLVGGSAVTMSGWIDAVDAIVDVWYPGEVGGVAVAEVLFGDVNPGGKLPITFPRSAGQLPLYYNHKPTGRGDDYLDMSGVPLFPFGYGMSYTTFEYSGLEVLPRHIQKDGRVLVKFRVRNSGSVRGDEVTQLYIRKPVANVVRPVMELKGFERISLSPGESREVSFEISTDQLSLLNERLEKVVEAGEYRIMIGSSSRDIRLRGDVRVVPQ
jgi:beta-glucosidase